MQLAILPRSSKKKLETKRLLTNNKIPAILYNKGKDSTPIAVDRAEFDAALRGIPKGHLSTTVFSIKDESGQEFKALVKEIQYHKTTYQVIHMDFVRVSRQERVTVNVPVVLANVVDCAGVKLGGNLRQMVRQVQVSCLGDQIPPFFQVDVKDLQVGDMRKVQDLQFGEGVRPLLPENDVIVMITNK